MRLAVQGLLRTTPLVPTCALAEGEVARALLAKLLAGGLDPALRGVSHVSDSAQWVAIEGPADALPWVQGIRYFGVEPSAPGLRLSTTHAPCFEAAPNVPVHAGLFERALRARFASEHFPLLVLDTRMRSLAAARALDPQVCEGVLREMERRAPSLDP